MNPYRASMNAEAAKAAAAQAEFNEKKWVWVPDAKEGYLAGWVNREVEEEDAAEVIMASGGEVRLIESTERLCVLMGISFRKVPFESLFKMNPPKFDRVEDIADLTFLNEASVVHNLRLRYGSGAIYVLFLVAINPYNICLCTRILSFNIAERAWVNMGDERENQSILITGESGAGKTESTKKVIQYLAAIATDAHLPATAPTHSRSNTVTGPFPSLARTPSRKGHVSTPSILQANPILEAFGNAQTQRNNNSSRFGKFVRIMFSPDGSIAGANIDWYLLEKSRVVFVMRLNGVSMSFTNFWQAAERSRNSLLLNGPLEDYEYLNKSRREVDGVDDKEEWGQLKAALDTVGFSNTEQFDLFRIIAAILHIGNIVISGSRANFIGVLDIAGFEIFEVNSYEQLLINYTNEKLQQFFNHHMFVLEQEEYAREGIKWDYVNFGPGSPTDH
ncbi:P-loop containing nucleoside triphosphate hydrolase protein [Coprinopsis sp. MPI-PUGE-AT-0042]|nr:P-loop containing nucleoside triphosphate hydrolase protein [Coprinopsis sp. MPI-PUGE-AT-0042]